LKQDQVARHRHHGPPVAAGGRGAAAIGIHDAKPQNIFGHLRPSPVPVPSEGIVPLAVDETPRA